MRRWVKATLAATASMLAGCLLALTPIGADFEQNVGLAWLFNLRGPLPTPPDALVLAITDQTGDELGLSRLPREWPRAVHARLIENLTRLGAAVIVFDMDFQLPKDAADNLAFSRAAAASGRVIVVEKLVGRRQPLLNAAGQSVGSVWVEQLQPPFPELAAAIKGLAPFPLPKVQVAIHQFWTFKSSVDAATMPAAALQVYCLPAYAHLQSLMRQAGVEPPPLPAAGVRAEDLRSFMQAIRQKFIADSELGQTLRGLLAAEDAKLAANADHALVQALISLYEGEENRYLNLYGPPGSMATWPYQLFARPNLAGQDLPDVKGKVVFVGFSDLYDPGQPDRFYTVFSNAEGVDLSGVEIAATAFGNLLADNTLKTPGMAAEMLILACFGIIAGALAYFLPAGIGLPVILLLAGAYLALAYQAFVGANLWLPLATPLSVQLPLALFIGLLGQYLSAKRHKTWATQAISRYLPENLVRDFTENKLDENALNKVTYCVCFASDMAGFTTISEQLNPKALAVFLNDYFETLSVPLRRYGVDVLEFRADGIMCAWTADQPSPAVRQKALFAALEAVAAIEQFQQRHHQYQQSLRIGLEAGMAYVGHAGGGGHFVYSIVGDCANTAARIEGLNKKLGTQLLTSQNLVDGLDDFLVRYLGDFQFVGKAEALPIYEIMAVAATAASAQLELHSRYAAALALLGAGKFDEAAAQFAALGADFPDDGPARFHAAYCLDLAAGAIVTDEPLRIRLDSK